MTASISKADEDQDTEMSKEGMNSKRAGDCPVNTLETTNSMN